jgi:hypothetical protein
MEFFKFLENLVYALSPTLIAGTLLAICWSSPMSRAGARGVATFAAILIFIQFAMLALISGAGSAWGGNGGRGLGFVVAFFAALGGVVATWLFLEHKTRLPDEQSTPPPDEPPPPE